MRSNYVGTKDSTRFPIGSIVKCIVGGTQLHPAKGKLYEVVDCYFYYRGEFIDVRSVEDTSYEGGGWFCNSFVLNNPPEPETIWRRISL